ncbi:MAG: hypothetical protein QOG80_2451 [Pseudonocardiales bacterium]|nr:hypothetical protein [Pseudonocardiales bacterium]
MSQDIPDCRTPFSGVRLSGRLVVPAGVWFEFADQHQDRSPYLPARFAATGCLGRGGARELVDHGGVKLKLDLHEIYNRNEQIEDALRSIIAEAVAKKAPLVEIIPGKGSGQLKKRVLRFLDQKEIKALYHRVEKDSDNFGRVFVHFRWK